MGCPVKKVVNGFAGSALMKDEILATKILESVSNSVKVPVTLKMRKGWDDNSLNAPKIAKIAENSGIKMITIHASGGIDMMKAAVEAVSGTEVKVFGVTALTSLSDNDTIEIFNRNPSEQVKKMLDLAELSGIDGVVCSPHELELVNKRKSLLSITPGIRLQDNNDDQKRVMTAKEAINLGADYLVIGRPITQSSDISRSLLEIYESIN